jgi:hypothetical protein
VGNSAAAHVLRVQPLGCVLLKHLQLWHGKDLCAVFAVTFAHCDKAYECMTDSSGTELVKVLGFDKPKLGVLIGNNMHKAQQKKQNGSLLL